MVIAHDTTTGKVCEPPTPSSVTVVIPAFNAQDFIQASVESAIRAHPARVIVIDDGSTDATAEVVRRTAVNSCVPVDLIPIAHAGEAGARNAGLAAAETEWVAFLDADDRFLPGRLEKLTTALGDDDDLDAITSDAYMELDGSICGRCYGAEYRFAHHDQAAEILRANFVFGHVVVRRSRLVALGGFDESISHTTDWAMWIDLVLSGGRIGFVDEPLSVYRVHHRSASADQLRMAQGAVASLRHADRNPDLDLDLRPVLAASLEAAELAVAAQQLDQSLESCTGIRAAASAVLFDARQELRTRLKALGAATVPGVAAAWKRRRRRDRATGTAGWDIPMPTHARPARAPTPLVSVVIAFLDEKRFLSDAVETVRAQTMADWELLLVDDGSTDGSGKIADSLARESPEQVRVLRHPGNRNEGLAASRNLGLKHARGGTVAFLDADDRWEPDKLQVQLCALADHPHAGFVAGATRHRFLDQDRPDEVHRVATFGSSVFAPRRFARELLRERIPMPPPPSSVLYRTAALRNAGGVPAGNSTYEDQRTFVVVSLLSPLVVLDRVVTTYARRSDSLYGRLGDDNVTKSRERRQFEWWALRTILGRSLNRPRSLTVAAWLIAHRLRVAVGRRLDAARDPHEKDQS